MLLQHIQRLLPVVRLQHGIALRRQVNIDRTGDLLIVITHQNCLRHVVRLSYLPYPQRIREFCIMPHTVYHNGRMTATMLLLYHASRKMKGKKS